MDVTALGDMALWGDDYITTADEGEEWLVEPVLPAGGLINLYGKPKTGKSYAAIGMALAISNPEVEEWCGLKIRQHGPVFYAQFDTPRAEWKRRFRTIKEAGYNISQIAITDLNIAPYPFNVVLPTHQTWLEHQMELVKPVMVVIDTLREAHDGDENNSTDMKKVISAIVKAASGKGRPRAAVVFVSHSRKDSAINAMGAESDLMDEGRGSSYISGRMDTIMKFTGGKKGRGHMYYKGRSVEETKVPIVQEEGTGLVTLEGHHAAIERETIAVLKEYGKEWTVNKMATEISKRTKGSISVRRAKDWVKKLAKLVVDTDVTE